MDRLVSLAGSPGPRERGGLARTMRARSAALVLGALALALARLLPGLAPDGFAGLAAGTALLAFWAAAALRVGRFAAARVDPDAGFAANLVWTSLYAYAFVLACPLLAGAFGLIGVTAITLLSAVPLVALGLRSPPPSATRLDLLGSLRTLFAGRPVSAAIVLGAGALVLANAAWGFLLPPFAHDDLSYHLVFPVEWLRTGTLSSLPVPFGNNSQAYYPMNTEVFYLWLLLPVRLLFHLNAVQAGFLALAVLALYEIFKRCGASRRSALVAASMFCFCPQVAVELVQAYVDVVFACFFLIAILAALAFRASPSVPKAWQVALATGILCGTKVTGLLHLALILGPVYAAVLVLAWRATEREARVGLGRACLAAAGALLVFTAAGGWWYLRNLLVTGNPIFPLHVQLFGWTIFPGALDSGNLPPSQFGTLGYLFLPAHAALVGAGAVYTARVALAARRPGRSGVVPRLQPSYAVRALATALVIPAILALMFRYLLPYDQVRMVLALNALSGAALLVALDAPRRAVRLTAELLVVAAVLAAMFDPTNRFRLFMPSLLPLLARAHPTIPDLVKTPLTWAALGLAGLTPLVLAAAFLPLFERRWRLITGVAGSALLLLTLKAGAALSAADGSTLTFEPRAWRRPYIFLDAHYRGVVIASTGSNQTLPLHGEHLSNVVRYVSVNRQRGAAFHDYVRDFTGDRKMARSELHGLAYYRAEPDYEAWLANLEAAHVDLLVAHRLDLVSQEEGYVHDEDGFPLEAIWAEAHRERFERVHASPRIRIYELRR